MKKYTVSYFASPQMSVPPLASLLKHKQFEVISVITHGAKKSGRNMKVKQSPVEAFATLNNLIVHTDEENEKIEEWALKEKPDFFVVCAYGKILPESMLSIPAFGSVNIHFSLLPKYRGASPIQESLLSGDETTGVTLILMNEKMDEGDILTQKTVKISTNDTFESLAEKLSLLSSDILPNTLLDLGNGKARPISQVSGASYCRKIRKEDGRIDPISQTAKTILRKIRAYTPWPGAFISLSGKRIKILSARVDNEQKIDSGKWLIIGHSLLLGTKEKAISVEKIQPEGKNPMDVSQFINGYANFLT